MKLRLSKHLVVAALVAVAIAVVAGGEAQASNMGFKLNKVIPAFTSFPTGFNLVALPFRNPYTTANDLCVALTLPAGATVTQYDTAAGGTPSAFTCGDPPATAYTLFLRLGVQVQSPAAAGGIIVGSHQPGALLYPINDFVSFPDAYNLVGLPYHTTAVTAADVCTQAGLPAGTSVTRYDAATGTPSAFLCGDPPGTAFALVLSEALEVLTPNGSATVNFSPPHF